MSRISAKRYSPRWRIDVFPGMITGAQAPFLRKNSLVFPACARSKIPGNVAGTTHSDLEKKHCIYRVIAQWSRFWGALRCCGCGGKQRHLVGKRPGRLLYRFVLLLFLRWRLYVNYLWRTTWLQQRKRHRQKKRAAPKKRQQRNHPPGKKAAAAKPAKAIFSVTR